jgi:E3 Ubiquitin ligase
VDAPVYVLGTVQADGQVGAPSDEGEEARFLISYRSEEQLQKKLKRDALWLGLIGLGLILLGLLFVAIGAGVAISGLA